MTAAPCAARPCVARLSALGGAPRTASGVAVARTAAGKPRAAFAAAALTAVALALSGCGREVGADVYDTRALGSAVRTERAVVEAARPVRLQDGQRISDPRLGAVIGGAAGGAIGREIGAGWGQVVAIGAGIVLGAVAGALAESELSKQDGVEYVVRTADGRLFTIVQGPENPVAVGAPVFVQFGDRNGRARVIPA